MQSPESRHEILKLINRLSLPWWRRFLSLKIAIAANNEAWALDLKRTLIKSSPFSFLIKGIHFEPTEQVKLREFILMTLKSYQATFDDGEGVKILSEKITSSVDSNEIKAIRNRMDADWSLSELREKFRNPLLKTEFFDFWYMVMMNRTSNAEVRSLLRRAFTERSLKMANDEQLWVLEHFFSAKKEMREPIIKRLSSMWNSQGLTNQYTVLRASQTPAIKKLLSERVPEFKKPQFKIKRELYDKLLRSGYATEYALYELFFLGDKNLDNLWWLIL